MRGSTLEEVYDYLENNHEIEFTYNNCAYSIEPDEKEGNFYLVIWQCSINPKPLCRQEMLNSVDTKKAIDSLFNKPCFDGKTFLDVAEDICIEKIF